MKKTKYLIFIFVLLFFSTFSVDAANRRNNLKVDIVVDENGNTHITEVWDMVVNQDTEIYKQQYGMGNMTISNFKVRDEDRVYTYVDDWDIDDSFNEKKYKYGINYVDEGLELCWGISEYGNKKYTITYTVNNAVFNTTDAQVLYMRFVNDSSFPPKNFQLTITGYNKFEDTLDVWGYGYKGYAYVQNGKIFMSNEEKTPLASGDNVVLLVKFPVNTFDVDEGNVYSQFNTFNDVYDAAEEGTFDYDYDRLSFAEIISIIFSMIVTFGSILSVFFFAYSATQKYKFGPAGKKIKMKEINNFRDIPCNKDVFKAYFMSQAYGLNKNKTDFVGTLFLKWFLEGHIQLQNVEKKKLLKTTKEQVLVLNNSSVFENSIEQDMYDILKKASVDGVLEDNELKNWAKKNYNSFYSWFDKAEKYGRDLYMNEGFVQKVKLKYLIKDELKEEAIRLAGLKKYLIEFSNMKEKEAIEVQLWKEYLMFAQIFGIADKVAKQFKDLYPEVVYQMNEYGDTNMDVFVRINSFSNSMVRSASSARSAAQSYSSGGGGFSSGGGGGGSFGGGFSGSR